MLYCCHCGKQINEEKVDLQSSLDLAKNPTSIKDVNITYVCPRCGSVIHKHCSAEEKKELARAAHAQVQIGNNSVASGLNKVMVGGILAVIAFIFFLLSRKATNNFQITIECAEFWVFVVLAVISVILLSIGVYSSIVGNKNRIKYEKLLKDLNNDTFAQ